MATISIEPQHLKSGMSYKVRARSGKKDPIKFSMSRTFKKQSQAARLAKKISRSLRRTILVFFIQSLLLLLLAMP